MHNTATAQAKASPGDISLNWSPLEEMRGVLKDIRAIIDKPTTDRFLIKTMVENALRYEERYAELEDAKRAEEEIDHPGQMFPQDACPSMYDNALACELQRGHKSLHGCVVSFDRKGRIDDAISWDDNHPKAGSMDVAYARAAVA
jgi:hypothetical protein